MQTLNLEKLILVYFAAQTLNILNSKLSTSAPAGRFQTMTALLTDCVQQCFVLFLFRGLNVPPYVAEKL